MSVAPEVVACITKQAVMSLWSYERRLALIRNVGNGVHKTRFIHNEVEMSLGIHECISCRQMDV